MPQPNIPKHWDNEYQYEYRKHAGIDTQRLIDKLNECTDIIAGRKPVAPPYTVNRIRKVAVVIVYILKKERKLDIKLARQIYKQLENEMKKF